MVNVLITDYHNMNSNVINHINLSDENAAIIDWKDFENEIVKKTNLYDSNINVHIYDGILISDKIINMLNKNNVTVTLKLYDIMDNNFFYDYYIKLCKLNRLSMLIYVTGQLISENIEYIDWKLISMYTSFHSYFPDIHYNFGKNISNENIEYYRMRMLSLLDNRTSPIPIDSFAFIMNDFAKEDNAQCYIPYNLFIEKDGIVTLNPDVMNFNKNIEIPISSVDSIENLKELEILLNEIYQSIHNTYGCNNCYGKNICPKFLTIYNDVSPEDCSKTYERVWKPFNEMYEHFKNVQQSYYNIDNREVTV